MLDHHIQRSIVYRLAFTPELRFSDLKPDSIDNKLFSYHLKKVMGAKLVTKQDNGNYSLTAEGRRLGIRVLDKQLALVDQPESVLFLAIRRKADKAWLLYLRKTHPLFDRVGFMHTTLHAGQSLEEQAAIACKEKTGLTASFRVLGAGVFETYIGSVLESYTNFTFLVSDDAEGELEQNDEFAEYFWSDDPDFTDDVMLPNMKLLGRLHKQNQTFFVQETFSI